MKRLISAYGSGPRSNADIEHPSLMRTEELERDPAKLAFIADSLWLAH